MKHNDNKKTRRDFVRQTALAAGGIGLLAATSELSAAAPPPSHRSIQVAGIHAYADKLSVEAGDEISFKVSNDTPYTMQIYRLGLDPDKPDSDPDSPNRDVSMSNVFTVNTPSQQPIYPGSYVHVKNALPATTNLTALTLECWVRPFLGRPKFEDSDFNFWLAYNSRPFLKKAYQQVTDSQGRVFKETSVTDRRSEDSGDDVPEFSCYQAHQNVTTPYHFGWLLPQPSADPYLRL
jgi:hypothetical protein